MGEEVRQREGQGTQRKQMTVDVRMVGTYPEDTSHTLIVLSLLAETNLSPSCVNLTVEILWSCPCNVLMFLYSFAVSHNFIVRSVEHVTDISFSSLITVFGQPYP